MIQAVKQAPQALLTLKPISCHVRVSCPNAMFANLIPQPGTRGGYTHGISGSENLCGPHRTGASQPEGAGRIPEQHLLLLSSGPTLQALTYRLVCQTRPARAGLAEPESHAGARAANRFLRPPKTT